MIGVEPSLLMFGGIPRSLLEIILNFYPIKDDTTVFFVHVEDKLQRNLSQCDPLRPLRTCQPPPTPKGTSQFLVVIRGTNKNLRCKSLWNIVHVELLTSTLLLLLLCDITFVSYIHLIFRSYFFVSVVNIRHVI